jgi:glycosyltransferase involved in cell wall biosynthesis
MTTGKDSLRILYVSESIPQTASFGGELRCLHVARALRQLGDVDVAILNTKGKTGDLAAAVQGEFPPAYVLDVKPRTNEGWIDKIRWTFDPRSSYPFGCGVEGEPMRRFLGSLDAYDLVWFFSLRAPEIFPHALWKRSVVDIDDLPTTYQHAALKAASGLGERLAVRRRLFSWRRRETLLGKRFSVLTVCSKEDKQYLEQIGIDAPIHIIQNGFEAPQNEPSHSPVAPPRLGFIGLFDYLPNRDGIDWFIRQCWPLIRQRVPQARLRLVGKDSHGLLQLSDSAIDRLGWLTDTSEEISTWSAMVVPIRVGAGTRIKIAHGFSQKCPVVSTTFGAYGYGAVNGREMYLADSAEEFANACVRVIQDTQSAAQMADRAWRQFLEKWTWDAIRPSVRAAVEDCLQRSAHQRKTAP